MRILGRVLGLWMVLLAAAPAGAAELRAGAARAEITPSTGFPLWGYSARKDVPSAGVLDPLHARVLVLEAGGQRMALVSLDLGRAPCRQSMAVIRARVKAEAGIEHLFLVASHTHHGPILELDNWPTPKDSYVRKLEQQLSAVIIAAAKELRPARLGVAAKETDFNRNRHSRRMDKPVDRELLVLRVEDAAGKPIAHAVNFAAHSTLLDRQLHKVSADYPGALAALVEKKTGAPCLFLQGACGDLSPNVKAGTTAEQFGEMLGREVLNLSGGITCKAAAQPSLHLAEEDFQFKIRYDMKNGLLLKFLENAFTPEFVSFYEREYREGVRPHLSVALLNERIGFVGVSGEVFCGHALSLKRRAQLEHVFFLGYCNDYQQYLPTIEAAAEEGYGADPLMAPAAVGAGEQIIDRALIRLFQMRGKLSEATPRGGASPAPPAVNP